MDYKEEEYLQLSGIQHFLFCRRQWALIHIEDQWCENYRTTDGKIMHENAHDPYSHTLRNDVLTTRALRIHSSRLGVSGECDIVEFHKTENGVILPGREGFWSIYPVEYKRGEPKQDNWDRAQLCAQAMCLEEMYCADIAEGALFYGEDRRRERVTFDEELRRTVEKAVSEMHLCVEKQYTPKAEMKKACNACSLKELCLPELTKARSVQDYILESLRGEA